MTWLRRKPVKVYYWHGVSNFGDTMAPLLLERFTGRRAVWDTVSHADAVVTGSVLEHIPPEWDGHIVGAGRLYEDSRLQLYTRTAHLWALRGPLTARGIPGSYALGDPGLLADELVSVPERDIDLGVVPHHTDKTLADNPQWFGRTWTTLVIDPRTDPLTAVASIGRCRKIVSSSLHGLITADAFGIPRRFELNPHAGANEGGLFKFLDYSASVGLPLRPGEVQEASRFRVEDRKYEIYDAFRGLDGYLEATQ